MLVANTQDAGIPGSSGLNKVPRREEFPGETLVCQESQEEDPGSN
ncbi:hypothetical protein CRE_09726 [Caenorhabditis remanei]|uniref:Uncharacterized protein n=1 Tax=Caenorhabditis remanei TaxID=31234 RepID=E3N4Z0_CAERE|nr:hypothetical protein CRE_09726 [Caenorhabditis remanei]